MKESKRTIQIDNEIFLWDDTKSIIDKNNGEEISIQECRNRWRKIKDGWKRRGWPIDYDAFYEHFALVYDEHYLK